LTNSRFSKSIKKISFIPAVQLLSGKAKRKFLFAGILQTALGLFDLIAILIIGIIGSLAVAGISGFNQPGAVEKITRTLHISGYSFQKQIAILAIFSAFFLISKTLVSMWITKKTLGFLGNQGREISNKLLTNLLQLPNIRTALPDVQKTIFIFARGISEVSVGLLGSILNIVTDFSLLMILVTGLLLIDPVLAIFSFVFFSSLALALYGLLHKKARDLGREEAQIAIKTGNFLIDLTAVLEQVRIRNLESHYLQEFNTLQGKKTINDAEIAFLPLIGKYLLESSVVLGAILLCGVEFALKNSQEAIASLAVFLTAGTRITPALLRLQQSAMKLKLTTALSGNVFELVEELKSLPVCYTSGTDSEKLENVKESLITASNLNFNYLEGGDLILQDINFDLEPGKMLSIVGPSGSGKSTLASIIVGSLVPNSGSVTIQNLDPISLSQSIPGFIGYVPQDVHIIEGSFARNISLSHLNSEHETARVNECIEMAQLSTLVAKLPQGIDTDLRESKMALSGGERQRLGIARALFSQPRLLVLDEATSALDSETEVLVSDAIQHLKGRITIVLVAHRLSTVKNSDKIIYIEKGIILAEGTFDEVRARIPSFDKQAGLMGL
jgi:ABC-type multidrug transport system fused ATPase/permease subunit